MSGTPPAVSRAWTRAEIQERLRISVKHSAKIHPDQGKQATNRYPASSCRSPGRKALP